MWKSHYSMDTTTIGHYDLWHHTYSDQMTNNATTATSISPPPLESTTTIDNNNSDNNHIHQTPSVSLLRKKGLFIHSNPDYLHNRPFSPFSGYYGENDIYLGCEYDIFGSEPMIIPPTSTSTTNEQQHDNLSSSYNNDPFSIPPSSCSTLSSSSINHHHQQQQQQQQQQQRQLKRLRDGFDTNINQLNSFNLHHHDKRQRTKNGILSKEVSSSPSSSSLSSLSFNNHSITLMNDSQLEYC